jgi:sensor histidine kinase YesM
MLLLIQSARHLGPASGAKRVGLLAAAVLASATLAAAGRALWLHWFDGQPFGDVFGWPVFMRFAVPAGMLVTVAEFYRQEALCVEAMHAAEADRDMLEQQTLQARLRTLEAQIEPHFLFNTLATVRRLYETDPAAGEAMLDRLMSYLRVALPSMRGAQTTLASEAQLIEAYLDLQQVRMGRRLAYRVDIAPALRSIEVPPMMLLTLVENAIKHGLAPQREGGRIDVTARLDASELRLEVADTGRGFGGNTAGGGTGLANIRSRLAAMFGTAAQLTLESRAPRGLLATIRLPAGAVT